jgi:alpha-mannosidase
LAGSEVLSGGHGAEHGPLSVSPADDLSQKSLPATQSFCSFEGGNLILSALKKSETGDGLVLRAYDTAGIASQTSLQVFGHRRAFRELNLLEEEVAAAHGDTIESLRLKSRRSRFR